MHLTSTNCQCPSCVAIRTGRYNKQARNVYAVPLGPNGAEEAADSLQRLADDLGDWERRGVKGTKPVIALEGTGEELRGLRGWVEAVAAELRGKGKAKAA